MPRAMGMHKMKIQELHKTVHQGQDNGIPVRKTLKKYKVSDRAYYTRCKQNNLPSWSSKNKDVILTKRTHKNNLNTNLSGGSVESPLPFVPKGGNLSLPKNNLDKINEGIASNQNRIKAAQKKSIQLDIRLKNDRL